MFNIIYHICIFFFRTNFRSIYVIFIIAYLSVRQVAVFLIFNFNELQQIIVAVDFLKMKLIHHVLLKKYLVFKKRIYTMRNSQLLRSNNTYIIRSRGIFYTLFQQN